MNTIPVVGNLCVYCDEASLLARRVADVLRKLDSTKADIDRKRLEALKGAVQPSELVALYRRHARCEQILIDELSNFGRIASRVDEARGDVDYEDDIQRAELIASVVAGDIAHHLLERRHIATNQESGGYLQTFDELAAAYAGLAKECAA